MRSKHGMTGHPVYKAWEDMKSRCYNSRRYGYGNYGGRGIKVCDSWKNNSSLFIADMLPTWRPGLQLDRIDVNGNYEPSNCRWATASQNMKNRRVRAQYQSPIDGVLWDSKSGKWYIYKTFSTQDEAEMAAKALCRFINS